MRSMIVLISRVKLWIIVQSGDCIRDCIMDPFYIDDLGGIFLRVFANGLLYRTPNLDHPV